VSTPGRRIIGSVDVELRFVQGCPNLTVIRRVEFHRLLVDAERENVWTAPTRGTRWTNEQLLFPMVFGYMVVQRLLILMRMLGRLPEPASRLVPDYPPAPVSMPANLFHTSTATTLVFLIPPDP
jgi:hypothetical protein